ncbi:hypothetical protein K474DRAFT_1701087 [Panus rudis PR-1116 ss-1]|nr:hypothetical protein K474DRAFT_1701087 [Panus rudis PR-1116 ss-1]
MSESRMTESDPIFDKVTENLKAMGAIPLEEYLQSQDGDRSNIDDETRASTPVVPEPANPDVLGSDDVQVNPSSSPPDAAVVPATMSAQVILEPAVKEVEDACQLYTSSRVKPYWLLIKEPKAGKTFGYVLRIQLSSLSWRLYSVDTTYETPTEAQVACAEAALKEGVRDYLQSEANIPENIASGSMTSEPVPDLLRNVAQWNVQSFYDAIPKPFTESVEEGKSVADINAPAWLNTMLQACRGSKLTANFIWTSGPTNLHGCLLRLVRAEDYRSYLVDARFAKRAEAKTAVCLLAMSEGVGNYLRTIAEEVEARLPADVKQAVANFYLPTLTSEYRKLRNGAQPQLEYTMDHDACGCTLIVELCDNPQPHQVRRYTVPPAYRTRNDAKAAVVAKAASEGVIEFIRFQGGAPPPTYISHPPPGPSDGNPRKRQMSSDGPNGRSANGQMSKRRKSNHVGDSGIHAQVMSQPSKGYTPFRNKKGKNFDKNGHQSTPWKDPYSSSYSPMNGYQSGGYYSGQMQASPPVQAYSQTSPSPYMPPSTSTTYTYSQAPATPQYASTPYASASAFASDTYHPAQAYQSSPAYTPTGLTATPASVPYTTQPTASNVTYPASSNTTAYSTTTYSQPFQPYSPAQSYMYSNTTPQAAAPASAMNGIAQYPSPYSYPTSTQFNSSQQGVLSPAPYSVPPGTPVQAGAHRPLSSSSQTTNGQSKSRAPARTFGTSNGGKAGKSTNGKLTVSVESMPTSSVTELYENQLTGNRIDHCNKNGLPVPEFHNEIVSGDGENKHKVWVVIGKRKFELQTTFSSLSQGQKKVAEKVLEQLRS